MWTVVVQHEDHVTRVLGPFDEYGLAVDVAKQLGNDRPRGEDFSFTVHPLHARLPTGSATTDPRIGEQES